jgi:hypothetical protein
VSNREFIGILGCGFGGLMIGIGVDGAACSDRDTAGASVACGGDAGFGGSSLDESIS